MVIPLLLAGGALLSGLFFGNQVAQTITSTDTLLGHIIMSIVIIFLLILVTLIMLGKFGFGLLRLESRIAAIFVCFGFCLIIFQFFW